MPTNQSWLILADIRYINICVVCVCVVRGPLKHPITNRNHFAKENQRAGAHAGCGCRAVRDALDRWLELSGESCPREKGKSEPLVASLLLVVRPGAPSSFLLLVASCS